jgi:hypothetical protein
VGHLNPSSTAGSATYRWIDLNSDHFAQADEVLLDQFITAAGGFNPANPTAVISANQLAPNLKAPVTQSVVVGADRELIPNLVVQLNYSYTRIRNCSAISRAPSLRVSASYPAQTATTRPALVFPALCPMEQRTTSRPTFRSLLKWRPAEMGS